MALVPPRKNVTPTRLAKQQLTPLQAMMKIGIPQTRAEKALAAVGNSDTQLALQWLTNHVNDPNLDENEPREYVLYACPTGPFKDNLDEFWSESKEKCGWNGAHNCLPHITLVSFFKAPDDCESELTNTLKRVVDSSNAYLSRPLDVELFTNSNFMGLFVTENDANFLKHIALQYVKDVSSSIISETYEQLDALVTCFPWCGGVTSNTRCIPRSSRSISLEPHVKSLHLTLAYRFEPEKTDILKTLIEKRVDIKTASTYELRLYSRDPRVASNQVFRVNQPYNSHEADELELRVDDYIAVSEEALKNATDGWVEGLSCSTGANGLFPLALTTRVPESDAWTLHCKIQVCNPITVNDDWTTSATKDTSSVVPGTGSTDKPINKTKSTASATASDNLSSANPKNDQSSNEDVNASNLHKYIARIVVWDTQEGVHVHSPNKQQKLFVIRHGERVDFTFSNWLENCFDASGRYRRLDLNMPKSLPIRVKPQQVWKFDSPLTCMGSHQAYLTGDMLRDIHVPIGIAYTSPAFRCIQTCHAMLEGLNLHRDVKIRIEPGLFEWCGWYTTSIPDFCSAEELIDAGFKIDRDYIPFIKEDELRAKHRNETISEFYERNHFVSTMATTNTTDNILFVGHASNIDTNTRQLTGRRPLNKEEMSTLMHHATSYACMITAERNEHNKWRIVPPFVYPVSHNKNSRFDWSKIANFDPDVITNVAPVRSSAAD